MKAVEPGGAGEPEEVRGALRRLVLGLADTKRLLGIRYSDWLLGAPSIEAGIAASSMAQDEWGHARLLYASLRDFGDDPTAVEHERDAAAYTSWDPLDRPLADWAHLTAVVVIVDGAVAVALESALEGSYEPLAARAGKMLGEEEFHRSLGEAWFRRIAGAAGEGRERLAGAARAVLAPTVRCLAPGDAAHERLAERRVVLPSAELRARFADRVDPLLEPLELAVGGMEEAAAPETSAAPSEPWDAKRGRGPGHPGEEAVERARGDRNRALFVE